MILSTRQRRWLESENALAAELWQYPIVEVRLRCGKCSSVITAGGLREGHLSWYGSRTLMLDERGRPLMPGGVLRAGRGGSVAISRPQMTVIEQIGTDPGSWSRATDRALVGNGPKQKFVCAPRCGASYTVSCLAQSEAVLRAARDGRRLDGGILTLVLGVDLG